MVEKWYTFNGCECFVHRDKVGKVSRKNYGNEVYSGFICPDHKTRVAQRITYCVDCKEMLFSEKQGYPPIRCTKHAEEQREKMNEKEEVRRKEKSKKGRAVLYDKKDKLRGEYCTGYYACYADREKPKCFKCNRFIPIFKNVDPAKWR